MNIQVVQSSLQPASVRFIDSEIEGLGTLNIRLYDVQERLNAILSRSRGEVPEEAKGESASPPTDATFYELRRRAGYAASYVGTIEELLTELERFI